MHLCIVSWEGNVGNEFKTYMAGLFFALFILKAFIQVEHRSPSKQYFFFKTDRELIPTKE